MISDFPNCPKCGTALTYRDVYYDEEGYYDIRDGIPYYITVARGSCNNCGATLAWESFYMIDHHHFFEIK